MRLAASLSAAACLFLPLVLTGCALTSTAPSVPETYPGAPLTGVVHGGQAPVVGSHIYLYAANTTGSGGSGIAASSNNASVSLLNINVESNNPSNNGFDGTNYYVTTTPSGSFSLTGDYTCTAGQQVYIYAVGGDPGSGTNNASGEMAVLGNCPGPTFSSSLFVSLNEVTTVAAAYAFAGFATDATHVSSSGTTLAQTGIANAFANAANLASLSTGAALATTPGGNGTVPQTTINTIADILAACVNSAGPSSTGCTTLFGNISPASTATDTATAAIYLAQTPWPGSTQMTNLFGSPAPTNPFSNALTSQPNDFTIGINFTGGGLSGPMGIAIDGSGDAWIANHTGASLTALSPTGAALYNPTGNNMNRPKGIAVDTAGNVWTVNSLSDYVSEFNSSGTAVSSYTNANFSTGEFIAVDGANNVYASFANSILQWTASSSYATSNDWSPAGLSASDGIAAAAGNPGNLWVANSVQATVLLNTSTGAVIDNSSNDTCGKSYPLSVAIDSSGNAWTVTNTAEISGDNNIYKFSSSAVPLYSTSGCSTTPTSSYGYSGGGLSTPLWIAIDGSGTAWTSNSGNNSVSNFSSAGVALTPSTGYTGGSMNSPYNIAIDISGNVWVTNYVVNSGSVTELIGVAAPVVEPLAVAAKNSTLGTRP